MLVDADDLGLEQGNPLFELFDRIGAEILRCEEARGIAFAAGAIIVVHQEANIARAEACCQWGIAGNCRAAA